jgi:RNA polymerase sigma-B factor
VEQVATERYADADQLRRTRTATLLAAAANAGDEERRVVLGQVVELNMGVADALARRYRDRGIAEEDLRQVAFLALVKAANGFDVERTGAEFLPYAVPTIRGELRKHFRDHGWMVRPPRRIQELQTMLTKAADELTRTLHRSPRPTELAEHLGVDECDIIEALGAEGCFTPHSLDHPLALSSETVGDLRGDEDAGHLAAEARAMLVPLLEDLPPRDRHIIRRRFFDGWTQSEIGSEIGLAQMQVSRHLARILGSLRRELGDLAPPPTAA